MKLSLLVAFILLFSISTIAQNRTYRDLLGNWKEVNGKEKGGVQILDSVRTIWTTPQGVFDATYKVDFSKKPHWFDIVASNGTQEFVLKGIIEFLPDGKMKWELFPDGQRKLSFSKFSDAQAILYKEK